MGYGAKQLDWNPSPVMSSLSLSQPSSRSPTYKQRYNLASWPHLLIWEITEMFIEYLLCARSCRAHGSNRLRAHPPGYCRDSGRCCMDNAWHLANAQLSGLSYTDDCLPFPSFSPSLPLPPSFLLSFRLSPLPTSKP